MSQLNALEAMLPSLEGKVVVITGTTSGTGFHTAICAVRKNADVVFLLNRESERAVSSFDEIQSYATKSKLVKIECNLQYLDSVKTAAGEVIAYLEADNKPLDVLILNAGVAHVPLSTTEDGFEIHSQVNYLSQFLLTKQLWAKLLEAPSPRLVTHSSLSRFTASYDNSTLKSYKDVPENKLREVFGDNELKGPLRRYAWSKIHVALFALYIAKNTKVRACVADPGVANTAIATSGSRVTSDSKSSLIEKVLGTVREWKIANSFAQSSAEGSMPLILASFGSDDMVKSGDFFSPEYVGWGWPVKTTCLGVPVKDSNPLRVFLEGSINMQDAETCWRDTTQYFEPFELN